MGGIGKLILGIGVFLVLIGVILTLLGRMGVPLGRLPGDFVHKGKNGTVYFPIGTSILISIILSVVLFILSRFSR
jgi:hypothetical protein